MRPVSDTAVVGAATFLSRILGFLRQAVVSALFGQGWKADVLNAVFNIPMNLRKLVAEGALSTAFIPVLSQSLEEDPSGARARLLVRALFMLQLVVLVPLTVLGIVFAPQIIAVLVPMHGDLAQQALGVDLFRWFLPFLVLVSLSAVMMGVENTHKEFLIPALSPLLFSVAVIACLFLWAPSLDVYAQIPGVLLGGFLPVLVQWFPLRRLGYSVKPLFRFWIPEMKETLAKWGPALMVSGLALLNQQISMTLAATLPGEGNVSALTNAIVFWQLPAGVLSASVITVYFPKMSRLRAQDDAAGATGALVEGLELLALLLIPAGVLLALFSEPVVALAFQRGQYTYADTQFAARVLSFLAWGLFASGVFSLLQRAFYARGDFRTPFRVSVLWAVTDVVASVLLMATPLGVAGLALGSVIGYSVGALTLLVLSRRDLGWRRVGALVWFWGRVALATVPAAVAFEVSLETTGRWWQAGLTLESALWFVGEGLVALGLVVLGCAALGIPPWNWRRASGGRK